MRPFYYILPFLGAVALAQDLVGDNCQCPQVKCPGDDAVALCECLNTRERVCHERCPKYEPTSLPCTYTAPLPTPKPKPTSTPKPTPKFLPIARPVTCECLKISCLQVWPGSCHCANAAKQRCYDDCGGVAPQLQDCPAEDIVARALEPQVEVEAACTCDAIMCAQMWPESCYCANAAAQNCAKKCGLEVDLQECPPLPSKTLTTRIRSSTPQPTSSSTKTSTPLPTPSLSPNQHKVCGGGGLNNNSCDKGYICITDPYTPGCGPACDDLGICVEDFMCGGFAGFICQKKEQVCHDDPRDDCDPKYGGSDCGGLCIWPHTSLYGK